MKNLLVGNGLVIQFGGADYTNSSIILRSLRKIASGNFPSHLYPNECADLLKALHREYSVILKGKYDRYAIASFEKSALDSFKYRYSSRPKLKIDEIGLEDYFLIFELLHNKLGIGNPDRYNHRGVLRRMFLDSIFNNGDIQILHNNFPSTLSNFFEKFDVVFTTNYDNNLEHSCNKDIYHLHGSFHVLDEIYDKNSFRNQLSEDLLDSEKVDPSFIHLYSNCLVSYVSDLKAYSMNQADLANSAMDKFAEAYRTDESARSQIENWENADPITRRLAEAIRKKASDPTLLHRQQYSAKKLGEITGSLSIVGLSPYNDNHVFAQINDNEGITSIKYYYFNKHEFKEIRSLLDRHEVEATDVRELWKSLS